MAREKGVLTGRATVIAENGYSIICIDQYVEGIFFGSTLDVSIEPGTFLHNCRFNVTVPDEVETGIILLSLAHPKRDDLKTSFVKVSVSDMGIMHIGLLDSDDEWFPPAQKQFQMCADGKGFRFLMDEGWYTTDPREKRKYPYVPPSNGNLICKYLFEEDSGKEAVLANRLRQLVLEYEAEESEVQHLKNQINEYRGKLNVALEAEYKYQIALQLIFWEVEDELRRGLCKFWRILPRLIVLKNVYLSIKKVLPEDCQRKGGMGDV